MSCIVGLARNGGVWVGSDSGVSIEPLCVSDISDKIVTFSVPLSESIVFRREFVIGVAGSMTILDVIRANFIPPEYDCSDGREFVAQSMASIARLLADAGCTFPTEDGTQFAGALIVAFDGRIFQVSSNFNVSEPRSGIVAIGSGGLVALGVMHALKAVQDSYDVVMKSLEIAGELCEGVKPPYQVIEAE